MTIFEIMFGIACVIPALIIALTVVARLNDIKKTQASLRWWVRRIGLGLLGISMLMLVASYFTVASPYWSQIMRLCGLWGLALSWVTTPGMPPWWRYISRNDPKE